MKERRYEGLRSLYIFMTNFRETTYSFIIKEVSENNTLYRSREINGYENARNWIEMQEILYNKTGYFKRAMIRKSEIVGNSKRVSYKIEYVRKGK